MSETDANDTLLVTADGATAKDLVTRLMTEAELTPQRIAEELEHRVSSRTIYRWAKGESVPGNSHDLEALARLVDTFLT